MAPVQITVFLPWENLNFSLCSQIAELNEAFQLFQASETDWRFRGRDLCKQDMAKKGIFAEVDEWGVVGGKKFAIVLDGFKLIYTPEFQQYELFDLKTDPHEEHDLIYDDSYREQGEDLKVRLNRIRSEDFLGLRVPKRHRKLTDEEIEKLKSLGYVW